jgi:predicted MFS family arabinose efflux permease
LETGQSQVIKSAATFRSLSNYNYSLFAGGVLVSNIGTWMHRTAQDWIVLTQLTRYSATAIGVVMTLRYGPQIFLVPLSGHIADHLARQTFVAELVGEGDLSNAVALNSTSFNAALMIGPAIAGFMIAAIGSGWLFLLNAASYAAFFVSLCMLCISFYFHNVGQCVSRRG